MVNNELAAKKALSPAAILALEKEYAEQKAGGLHLPRQKFIVNSRR